MHNRSRYSTDQDMIVVKHTDRNKCTLPVASCSFPLLPAIYPRTSPGAYFGHHFDSTTTQRTLALQINKREDVLSMTRSFASGMDCSCDPDECVCCTRNDRDEVCVDILVGPSPDVAMYFRDTYVPITAQSKDGLVFGNCFDVFPGLVQICFDIYDIRLNLKGFNICAKFTVTMMKKDQLIDLGCSAILATRPITPETRQDQISQNKQLLPSLKILS
ncbi:hypothetical protein ScPMuIL_017265 [Solemya velum]